MGRHLTVDVTPMRPYQVRVCPADFAAVFIRGGWAAVRAEFGLNTKTERRCLEECGGEDLRRKRQRYLAKLRKERRAIRKRHEQPEPAQPTTGVLRAAVDFLRSRDGGGWLITATGKGDYYFGAIRIDPDELIDRARRKGFMASVDQPAMRKAG